MRNASVFIITLLWSAVALGKALEAWWLGVTFQPTQTSYEGLLVRDIDPEWTKLSVLDFSLLPGEAKEDVGWMRRDGFEFVHNGDLNRNGHPDRILCGVFETTQGQKGRFLLVIEKNDSGAWE